jgi:hypothetical protein
VPIRSLYTRAAALFLGLPLCAPALAKNSNDEAQVNHALNALAVGPNTLTGPSHYPERRDGARVISSVVSGTPAKSASPYGTDEGVRASSSRSPASPRKRVSGPATRSHAATRRLNQFASSAAATTRQPARASGASTVSSRRDLDHSERPASQQEPYSLRAPDTHGSTHGTRRQTTQSHGGATPTTRKRRQSWLDCSSLD